MAALCWVRRPWCCGRWRGLTSSWAPGLGSYRGPSTAASWKAPVNTLHGAAAIRTVVACGSHPPTTKQTSLQPGFRPTLYHSGALRLSPCNYMITSQRHYFRDTLAYYLSADFPPIAYAKSLLMNTHEMTGLPWWATIVLTTFLLRTIVTLPFSIYSTYILARVESLGPEIGGLSKQLKMEVAVAVKKYEWDYKVARHHYTSNMQRLMRNLYIRDNCHPFKASLIILFQLPMWFSLSLALRNMAGALPIKGAENLVLAPSLANEGLLWIPNLLVPDLTFILPVTLGLLNLAITEMHALRVKEPTKKQKAITNFFRGLSLVMIPVGAVVPSCMCLYWTCSSVYGFGQNVLLRYPSVRHACRIPQAPNESQTPFRDIYQVAKLRYGRKQQSSAESQDKKS